MNEETNCVRLQKYLAGCGIGSRRACESLITEGRVTVNGQTALLGMSVCPDRDAVCVDGKPAHTQDEKLVIAFNKPKGVVSTMSDPQGRKTVADYFSDYPVRLYNVGRLDIDSEGLLLMTNDGELAYRLTHPKYSVNKTYYTVIDGALSEDEKHSLESGVMLDDGMTHPARVTGAHVTATGNTALCITIHEGRNRQVRRMMTAVGHRVLLLRRISMGDISLSELHTGEHRRLTAAETARLYSLTEKK